MGKRLQGLAFVLLIGTMALASAFADAATPTASSGEQGIGNLLGYLVLDGMLGKTVADSASFQVLPEPCARKLAAAKPGRQIRRLLRGGTTSEAKRENLISRILRNKTVRSHACKALSFTIQLPSFDGPIEMFPTGNKPDWHVAMTAGPKVLRRKPLTKAFPAINDFLRSPKVTGLAVVVSSAAAEVKLGDLSETAKSVLTSFKQNTESDHPNEISLAAGVNLFAAVLPPTRGLLHTVNQALYPRTRLAKRSLWMLNGVVGGQILKNLLKTEIGNHAPSTAAYASVSSMHLDTWLPGFVPFPFNHLRDKSIFNISVKRVRMGFDVAASGTQSRSVDVDTWTNYSILRKKFSVHGSGAVALKGSNVEASVSGTYTPSRNDDPLGFINGISLQKLTFGAGLGQVAGQEKVTDTLTLAVGSTVKIADLPAIDSTLKITLKAEGRSVEVSDVQLALFDGGQPLKLSKLPIVQKIPLINGWQMDSATLGIVPAKSGPDFYITGEAEWTPSWTNTRKPLVMQVAITKTTVDHKDQILMFAGADSFSLGSLLPTNANKNVRKVMSDLKMPRTVLAFTTATGSGTAGEIKASDLPDPVAQMLDDVTDDDGNLPIFGDSITLAGQIDVSAINDATIRPLFDRLGLDKNVGMNGVLTVSGALSGLTDNKLGLSLAAALPNFTLPQPSKKNPLGYIIAFDKIGSQFYLHMTTEPNQKLELGISGNLSVKMPAIGTNVSEGHNDALDLTGGTYLLVDSGGDIGIRIDGSMSGTWHDPLGIGGLAIQDPAIVGGINATDEAEIGLGGTLLLTNGSAGGSNAKYALDADLEVIIAPIPVPTKLGLRYRASDQNFLTSVQVITSIIDGVLTGPASDQFINLLPAKSRKTARMVQKELAKANGQSIIDLWKLDQIPLPILDFKNLDVGFGTPGASVPGRKNGIQGLGAEVAGDGYIDLLGKVHSIGSLKFGLSVADGLNLDAKIPAFSLGKVIDVGGPPSLSVHAGTDVTPSFAMKGSIDIANLYNGNSDISLSRDGISLAFSSRLGNIFDLDFNAYTDTTGSNDSGGWTNMPILSAKAFDVKAHMTNRIDQFVSDTMLPAMGFPQPLAQALTASNPVTIRDFNLQGDLATLVRGDSDVTIKITPVFFGDTWTPVQTLIKPDIRNPKSLFIGANLTSKLAESFVDYLMQNPKKFTPVNLGILKYEGGELGGATVVRQDKQPVQQKAFKMSAAIKILGTSPAATTLIGRDWIRTKTRVSFIDGLIKSNLVIDGDLSDGKPSGLHFTGDIDSDLNAWIRGQVVGRIDGAVADTIDTLVKGKIADKLQAIRGKITDSVKKAIQKMDLVTVTGGSIEGDFGTLAETGSKGDVTMQLDLRILGKYDKSVSLGFGPNASQATLNELFKNAATQIAKTAVSNVLTVDDLFDDLGQEISGTTQKIAQKASGFFGGSDGSPWYKLVSRETGQCLDITGDAKGSWVQLADCKKNHDSQLWQLVQKAKGYVAIRNKEASLCMDVFKRRTDDGAPIDVWRCKWAIEATLYNQRFMLVDKGMGKYHRRVKIEPRHVDGMCLEPSVGTPAAGVPANELVQRKCNDTSNQVFIVVPQ